MGLEWGEHILGSFLGAAVSLAPRGGCFPEVLVLLTLLPGCPSLPRLQAPAQVVPSLRSPPSYDLSRPGFNPDRSIFTRAKHVICLPFGGGKAFLRIFFPSRNAKDKCLFLSPLSAFPPPDPFHLMELKSGSLVYDLLRSAGSGEGIRCCSAVYFLRYEIYNV